MIQSVRGDNVEVTVVGLVDRRSKCEDRRSKCEDRRSKCEDRRTKCERRVRRA